MLDFVLTRRVEELEQRLNDAIRLSAEAFSLVQELNRENIQRREGIRMDLTLLTGRVEALQEDVNGLHRQR